MERNKNAVHDFWNKASCGEELYLANEKVENYQYQSKKRDELEPYIAEFAEFKQAGGKKVLEIGVGLGADHQKFAEAGAHLYGVDLTKRAIDHTKKRLELFHLTSELQVADAENLPFTDNEFDVTYSWGVLHHTLNTIKAINEVWRVLKPGGIARIMVYHKYSIVGLMLWLRYGLLAGRPNRPLSYLYNHYLESPGTKAYTKKEAQILFEKFSQVKVDTVLSHGDLLTSLAGQRHQGVLLMLARAVWPRWIIKKFFPTNGLFMLITAIK